MRKISGSILGSIFAVLGLLRAYWALGGRRGLQYVLPTQGNIRLLNPSPAMAWVVTLAFFSALATTLGRMNVWGRQLPQGLFRWGLRTISLVFLLRAIGDFRMVGYWKTITETPFARWDTRLFSPLCIVIAALAALTDVGSDELIVDSKNSTTS